MKAWAQRTTGRRRIYIWLALALAAALIIWRLFFAGGGARPGMSMDAPPVRVATALLRTCRISQRSGHGDPFQ